MSSLKITDIEAIVCGPLPFTRVHTNEKGMTGIGENVTSNRGILEAQVALLKKMLVGEGPL